MKKSSKLLALLLVLVLSLSVVCLAACNKDDNTATPEANKVVRISTTTSVNDSGLMAYLAPYFTKDTGYTWEISSAGTGAALNAARYGNADALLVHSKASEEEFVQQGFAMKVNGYDAERVSFMYNFFVLVGPTDDATVDNVKAIEGKNVKDGFKAIADEEKLFVSRGDKSGTHNKEYTLWPSELNMTNDVNQLPEILGTKLYSDTNPNGWYISAGQGMGACLTMANEKKAYCLTDKATFLSFKNDKNGDKLPNLEIKWEEDNSMKNTYTMLAVNPNATFTDATGAALPAGTVTIDTVAAKVFMDWMTSEHAKALISFYGITQYGGSLFSLL